MRMQTWASALMSLVGALSVGSMALAQPAPGYPVSPGGGYVQGGNYPDPYLAQAPGNPGVFQPQYAPGAPTLPPGGPQDARFYPQISPHLGPNVMQERTQLRDGLWLKQIINRDRKWYGTIEYVHTDFSGPGDARIGSKPAYLDPLSDRFPAIDTWPDGAPIDSDFEIIPRGPGALPFVIMRETITDPLLGVHQLPPPDVFPTRSANILDDVLSSNGTRLRTGYFDRDGTGVQVDAWWGGNTSDFVQYGQDNIDGVPITQDLIAGIVNPPYQEYPLDGDGNPFNDYGGFLISAKVGGMHLQDPSDIYEQILYPGTLINGSTVRYDLLYRVDTNLNAGGANLNFFLGDVYSRPHVNIKSFTGLKYMYVDEKFGFRGMDSGFGYVIDPTTFRPTDGDFFGPQHPLFESLLNSTVTSHLAGPEFGFRGDLGEGGGFAMWWQGSMGLLVNHEKARVQGNNIGNALFFHTNPGILDVIGDESGLGTVFGPAYDMFANDTSFDDTETHTHVSPTLSLGLNAEIGIFDTIPGIRRISLFDDAKLNVGYNVTMVGMLAKAADSIRWEGFPGRPSAEVDYETFWMSQLSIGLHFSR